MTTPVYPARTAHPTTVLSIAQRKGGACKTTVAVGLVAELSLLGYDVLLIDLDDNPGATYMLLTAAQLANEVTPEISAQRLLVEPAKGVAGLLRRGDMRIDALDESTGQARFKPEQQALLHAVAAQRGWAEAPGVLDIVPGDESVRSADKTLDKRAAVTLERGDYFDAEGQLALALAPIIAEGLYDFIVIDTPPAKNNLLFNSIRAANLVIAPLDPEPMALRALNGTKASTGLRDVVRRIAGEKARHQEPPVELGGVVVTRYLPHVPHHQTLLRKYREGMGADLFCDTTSRVYPQPPLDAAEAQARGDTLVVPFDELVGLAALMALPPQFCAPDGKASRAFGALASQILARTQRTRHLERVVRQAS